MMHKLPYRGFKWVKNPNLFDIFANEDTNIGFILEVDIDIPIHLHDKLKDLPPLLTHEDFGNGPKLVGTLYNKKKYIIYIEMLKFVVQLGLVVTKIHRVLKFRQRAFLKKYMNLNTRLRKKSTDEFTRNMCKLKNNSIFGKTLQQNRNHENIILATSWKQAERYIAKPIFKRAVVFDKDLVANHLKKTNVLLNQPTYLGLTILEIAKRILFDFHYNFIMKHMSANLCYTGKTHFLNQKIINYTTNLKFLPTYSRY